MADGAIPPEKEFTLLLGRPLLKKDRRGARRYRCGPATLVQLQEETTGIKMEAWANNLSETGIGLDLPYPLDAGTGLVLRLRGRPPAGAVTMPARVVHATAQEDGTYRIGCAFERRLEPDQLEGLL
jgi:hypothetical protein